MTKTEEKVLEWVNRARKRLGLKPRRRLLKGHREEALDCPVSNSIDPSCSTGTWESYVYSDEPEKTVLIKHPQYITDFVRMFDSGKYPHLEKK